MAEGGVNTDQCDYMKCEKHPDKRVEIYCEHHVVVCCLSCAWKDHHECRPKPCLLEEAMQKFQDEGEGLMDQLMTCADACDKEVNRLSSQVKERTELETSVRDEFTNLKTAVLAKFDDFEHQLENDIQENLSNQTKELMKTLAESEQLKHSLQQIKYSIQNHLKTNCSEAVAAFVHFKKLYKAANFETKKETRETGFEVSKDIHNFLNCSSFGKFKTASTAYVNVQLPIRTSGESGKNIDEDDETMMSDVIQDSEVIQPRSKQERSGISFGKIFRLFKFRSNPELSAKKSTTNLNSLPLAANGKIEDEEWFHGEITRDVANSRLIGNGDYLLRAKPNQAFNSTDYVLSVCSKIQHHAIIKCVKGGWKFKGKRFGTIQDLIKHLHYSMMPLISASHKVILHTPVSSRPLKDNDQAATETIKRLTSCVDDEPGYADVFEVGDKISKMERNQIAIGKAIAIFEFNAKEKDELTFQKGEHLEILSKDEDTNWWRARNKIGQVGMIPRNYVTDIADQQATASSEDISDVEEDKISPYEMWAPPPSAAPEYEYCCDISEIGWFHGCLPRENAENRLNTDGDFLVREHREESVVHYILSVYWGGHRHFKYKKTFYDQPHNPVEYFIGTETPIKPTADVRLRNPILKETWEIRNNDCIALEEIHKGSFGKIHKGLLKSINKEVALHIFKENVSEDDKKVYLGAAQVQHQLNHSNIVKCFGIAMDYDPIVIVMEYMPGGSLLDVLRNSQPIDDRRKIGYCTSVADALAYLEEACIIHRDVAARNCYFNSYEIPKLSDFKLSNRLDSLRSDSDKIRIALKWTAPEYLRSRDLHDFCTKSDLWSFGVLIWEVFSNGRVPYPGLSNKEALRRVLDEGYRMPAPSNTPSFIAELITRCWAEDPKRRPHVKQILKWLQSSLEETSLETFKLPSQPPPIAAKPKKETGKSLVEKKPANAFDSSMAALENEMRNRPLPPLPPTAQKNNKGDANSCLVDDSTQRKTQLRRPPPPPVDEDLEEDVIQEA